MPIEFDPVNKWILITSPTVTESSLNIYCAAMDWCDELHNTCHPVPMLAVGKFDMGGNVYSDTIFQLINGWKLKFWSTTEHFKITGTLLPETPATRRHVTPADVEYQVATQGTIIISGSGVTEQDKTDIAEKVWQHTKGTNLDSRINLIRKIQEGRWKIENDQLIIYDDNGVDVLKTFNLSGEQTKAYSERVPA